MKMNRFSRKIVLILIAVFAQSSLGTNAALKDFSNVTTKSLSQNGYYKLPDGLMIQWGYNIASTTATKTIYFPMSFIDVNYSITISLNSTITIYILSSVISYRSTSYFKTYGKSASASSIGDTSEPILWIAIGRWK